MRVFDESSPQIADAFLARAHELAEGARGLTFPNPLVGSVVVADGQVVGEGYHSRAGAAHAEVAALAQAGDSASGATVYVTLEPCNHVGKTPACTDALIQAGVARVVIGMPDPNPDVKGAGAERLSESGIEVEFADDPSPFALQNEDWLAFVTRGRPWVTVKTALSLDGSPASRQEDTTRITGPAARRVTMQLRRRASVVMVGAATSAADAPSLLLRDDRETPVVDQPTRAVVGRTAVPEAPLADEALGESVVLLPESIVDGSRDEDPSIVTFDEEGGLHAAVEALGARGHAHVLIETGPALFTSAWQEGLIDELVLYHAGGMLGTDAQALFKGESDAREGVLRPRMRATEVGMAGSDAVTVWRPLDRKVSA